MYLPQRGLALIFGGCEYVRQRHITVPLMRARQDTAFEPYVYDDAANRFGPSVIRDTTVAEFAAEKILVESKTTLVVISADDSLCINSTLRDFLFAKATDLVIFQGRDAFLQRIVDEQRWRWLSFIPVKGPSLAGLAKDHDQVAEAVILSRTVKSERAIRSVFAWDTITKHEFSLAREAA